MNDRAKLAKELEQLSYEELLFVNWRSRWKKQARAKQIPPVDQKWRFFGIKSGRGFGKTLSAANWLGEKAWETPNSIWFGMSAPGRPRLSSSRVTKRSTMLCVRTHP